MSVKKLVAGEGEWTCVKEVLGWILDTEARTVTILERKLEEFLTLVNLVLPMGWVYSPNFMYVFGNADICDRCPG